MNPMTDTPIMIMVGANEPIRLLNVLHVVSAKLHEGELTLVMANGPSYTFSGEVAISVFRYLARFAMTQDGSPIGAIIEKAIAAKPE